jgi:hypothetical protein
VNANVNVACQYNGIGIRFRWRPVSELEMQIREDANSHLAPYSPSTDHSRPFGSNSMATRFPGQATLFRPMQGTPDTTASIRVW